MAYTKQTWQDLPSKTTPINASRLGHIEQGIYDAASTADTAASNASSALSGLDDKVDKVTGKGLSTNDFTDALQTKLSNIAEGAEVNVQSDWDEDDSSSDAFIQNKPTLGTAAYKNSTSVVTSSSDLVESGGVRRAIGIDFKNFCSIARTKRGDGEARRVEYNIEPIPQGTYIFSSTLSGNATSYGFDFRNANSEQIATVGTGEFTSKEITFTEEVSKLYTYISENDYNNGRYLLVDNIMVSKDGGSYEPYHASVEDTLKDAEVIEGKNLNYPSYNLYNRTNPFVESGLTVTFNKNGSVTINGTLASRISIDIHRRVPNNNDSDLYIGVGDYKVSVNEGFQISAGTTYNSASYSLTNTGTEVDLSITSTTNSDYKKGNAVLLAVYLWINAGTYNNAVIYPMISKEGGAWKPYTFPLKDVVPTKANNSVIGTVEDGSNPTKAYTVNEFMVRDGAFCQVTAPVTTSSTWTEGSNYTKKSIAEVLQSLMS